MSGFERAESAQGDELERSWAQLEALEGIAAETASEQPLKQTIDNITHRCVQRFGVEQGVIHLLEAADSSSGWRTVVRQVGTGFGGSAYRPTDLLLGWVLKHKTTLRINDTSHDSPIANLDAEGVRSLISAPLVFQGKTIGVLNLFNRRSGEDFTEAEERVVKLIAAQAAQVIHTAHLIGELREKRSELEDENAKLLRRLQGELTLPIIGSSPALLRVLKLVEQISGTSVDVLITGESGTGKELIARAIHESSPRAEGPFVALNCAALPDTLLESELFGVEKGVATGVDKRQGLFEAASGGTLFLDEVGDLDLAAQAKMLRALQERVVQRVGARETIPIDVRIIAATNKDLEAAVKVEKFREDLLYRLNVIHFRAPALEERREDIPQLVSFFAERYSREFQKPAVRFAPDALAALASRDWPGNVRQLQNEVKRLVICSSGPLITLADLDGEGPTETVGAGNRPIEESVAEFEKRLLIEALRTHSGNQTQTAKTLGLSRPGLFKKLRRHGIQASEVV